MRLTGDGGDNPAVSQRPGWILLAVLVLLAAFGLMTADLRRESLWNDEAWSAWAVRSPNVADTLARVREDVHPPLYFLLLDGWTQIAGESAYTLRLLSAWFALIGLAAVYAIGRRLFDRQTGLIALILLATASFFIYYAREARMYSLLLALAALSTWAYLRWSTCPTRQRTLIYALLMAALLYTHYAGALVMVTHVVHRVITHFSPHPLSLSLMGREINSRFRRIAVSNLRLIIPYMLALALFVPWLPVFLDQTQANPNGPLAIPVPTDWGTVAALVLILTGGFWWLFLLPFGFSIRLSWRRCYASAILLLALWLVLTPVALLALNAWVAPVYQVRYTIAMLPAGALLIAAALRHVRLSFLVGARHALPLQGVLLLALVYVQLTAYPLLWPGKSPWEPTIRQMIAARRSHEPTISDLAPASPAGYYDRLLHLQPDASLDLSRRLHYAGELRQLVSLFDDEPSVWVALPINTAKAWHIAAMLDERRGVGYRSSLVNMIFYRFDQGKPDDLAYRFGDDLRYEGGEAANIQFDVKRGSELCSDFMLVALAPLTGLYSAGLHVVDITGNRSIAHQDAGLGTHDTGEKVHFTPCLTIPIDAPAGYYHLELAVYNWTSGQRLPVIEDGSGEGLNWGDVMRLAAVNVSE